MDQTDKDSRFFVSSSTEDINPNSFYIVRCDGRSFSKLTSKLNKPFDTRFKRAMSETTKEVMNKFHCKLAMCHSDEISLLFEPGTISSKTLLRSPHMFGGRRFKIITTIASYISVRFVYHAIQNGLPDTFWEAHFDGRVAWESDDIGMLETNEVSDTISSIMTEINDYWDWRRKDCYRNCITSYARTKYSAKQLHQKKCKELITMDPELYENIPLEEKYGNIYRKENYETTMKHPKTGEDIVCTRSRIVMSNPKCGGVDEL